MTDMLSAVGEQIFQARVSTVTATALVAEFARNPGPKHGIVTGANPTSPVLTAALNALNPGDRLTVVADAATAPVDDRWLAGDWTERVTVVESLDAAEPADAIILADLVSGGAEDTRIELDRLGRHLSQGGTISAAVPAAPFLAGGAGEELDRQSTLFGIGSDLVLRNLPPVRVHRLRFTHADTALAEKVGPLERTSSVRLTADMHIDSSGVAATGILVGVAALARRTRPHSKAWLLPLLAAPAVAAFFRDPQRSVPEDDEIIVAASDGKVLGVERLRDERLGDGEFLRIAVFLSVLDVHINRSPVAGRVVDHFVVDGGFAAAMKPEAEHNVAGYTVLDTSHGTVAVAQRTGLIARRIVHRAPVGALLAKGERFGLIRFGSRTDVYLPADAATATVAPGDRVVGGETSIARWLA